MTDRQGIPPWVDISGARVFAMSDVAAAQARACAWIMGQVLALSVTEFGDQHALAVQAAYGQVKRILREEMLRACGGVLR